jgi:LemA protein
LAVVVEQYPVLKADQGFLKLQDTLKETEDKISFTRQFYNDMVLSYNNRREVFPSNLIANGFNFKEAELFKLDDAVERKNVKVSF